MNHIDKSQRCCALYYSFVEPMDDDSRQAIEVEAVEDMKVLTKEGWKRHKAKLPVQRLQGPYIPAAHLAGICHKIGLRGRLV